MRNVTQYLRDTQHLRGGKLRETDLLRNFLRMQRVKYLIAAGARVEAKPGRYGGTFFSDDLFVTFQTWLEKKPIPLLNRKEYEIQEFIRELFGDEVVRQHRTGNFIYDWFIPSLNLLIEFNEREHTRRNSTKANDRAKQQDNLFTIHEATAMKDLARLAKQYLRSC